MRTATAVVLFALGLFGLTAHGYVDVEDIEICYQAVSNLLDEGSLAIPDTDNGRALIAAKYYVLQQEDGQWYPIYPLMQFLVHVPGMLAGRALSPLATEHPEEVVRLCFTLTNAMVGVLIALVIFALCRRLGQTPRLAAAIAMLGCAGTMLWPNCQSTLADPPLALFVSTSVLCLLHAFARGDAGGRVLPWIVLAGVLHGCAAGQRPSALLLLAPSAWYVRRAGLAGILAFVAPALLVLGGLVWFECGVLGRPFEAGWIGWGREHPPVWTYSYTNALYGLLFSDGFGLFTLSPLLLLAVLAWPKMKTERPREAWLFLGHLAALVLFFAAFDGWYGGWCWGPRYLLPAVPLLCAAAGFWLQRRGLWRLALTVVLASASFGIQVLATAVPHRIHWSVAQSSEAHPYNWFYLTRHSPVLTHARILSKKLRGEPDVYSIREVLDEPDDTPVRVTEHPQPQIDRYNAGFEHLAIVRVFTKGHWLAGSALVAAGLGALGAGLWLGLRRPHCGPSGPPGDDGEVGADGAGGDEGSPDQPRYAGQDLPQD